MEKNDLSSCPCCSSCAEIIGEFEFWVECKSCGLRTAIYHNGQSEAIEAWERREG